MIDKIFMQEILNAELRRKYFIHFFIYNLLPICFHKLLLYCKFSSDCILPINYKANPLQGTLIDDILNSNFNNGITQEELYNYYKLYKSKKKRENKQNK